jgi:hypothetical protein
MVIPSISRRKQLKLMSSQRIQKLVVCALAAVTASVVGNFVVAAAVNDTVTICVSAKDSSVRYSGDKSCKAGTETLLTLNESGPAGVTGSKGLTGATGATGPTGAAGGFATTYSIREVTVTHTVQASDAGKLLISRDGTTIFLPTNASVPIPIGTRIDIANRQRFLTVSPAAGVTINFEAAAISFDTGNYQMGTIIKITADEWVFMSPPDEFP